MQSAGHDYSRLNWITLSLAPLAPLPIDEYSMDEVACSPVSQCLSEYCTRVYDGAANTISAKIG